MNKGFYSIKSSDERPDNKGFSSGKSSDPGVYHGNVSEDRIHRNTPPMKDSLINGRLPREDNQKNENFQQQPAKKNLQWLSQVILFIAFILLWQLLSLGRKTLIFPSPLEVVQALAAIITGRQFIPSVLNTVKAVLISFAAAFLPALALGTASKFVPLLNKTMESISGIIRSVPTVAIILMALLLLPVSITPIVICFFVVFPVLYTNISEGLISTDPQLLEMAQIYRISRERVIRSIYIPSLKPFIAAGCRSALGLSFKIMVTAEVFNFVTHNTIGAQMYLHKIQIDLAGIIAWTIIVIVLSLLFDFALKKLFEGKRKD